MNFVQSSVDSVSYDASFRRNLVRICKKCILHFHGRQDIKDFLHQSSQLVFLETDECLEDTERVFEDFLPEQWTSFSRHLPALAKVWQQFLLFRRRDYKASTFLWDE